MKLRARRFASFSLEGVKGVKGVMSVNQQYRRLGIYFNMVDTTRTRMRIVNVSAVCCWLLEPD